MVIHCETQKEQKLIEEKVLMVRGEGSDGEVLAVRAAGRSKLGGSSLGKSLGEALGP